jgi:hypothetical protein
MCPDGKPEEKGSWSDRILEEGERGQLMMFQGALKATTLGVARRAHLVNKGKWVARKKDWK